MYRMTLEIFVRHLAAFVERRRAQGFNSSFSQPAAVAEVPAPAQLGRDALQKRPARLNWQLCDGGVEP